MKSRCTPIISLFLPLLGACNSTPASWPAKVITKANSASGRLHAELRADSDTLLVGYENFAVVLRDDKGNLVKDADVRWFPLMRMGDNGHSAPVDSSGAAADSTGAFRAGVVFVMPSLGHEGSWILRLRIHDHRFQGPKSHDSIDLPVTIHKAETPRLFTFKAPDGSARFAALAGPRIPKSGLDALDLFIARKDSSGLNWPADSSWTVTFSPSMPDMGHGSTDNVQPRSNGKGHYRGKVNYTMGGTWRLAFKLQQNGTRFVDTAHTLDIDVSD